MKESLTKKQLMKYLLREMFKTHDLIHKLHHGTVYTTSEDTNVHWQYMLLDDEVNELRLLLSPRLKAQMWTRNTDDKLYLQYEPKDNNTIPIVIFLTPRLEINFKATPCPKGFTTKVHPSVNDVLNKASELINSKPNQEDLDNAAGLVLYGLQSLGERNLFMLDDNIRRTFMSKENAHRYFKFFNADVSKHTFNQLAKCKSKYVDLTKPSVTPHNKKETVSVKPVTAEHINDMIQNIITANPKPILNKKI